MPKNLTLLSLLAAIAMTTSLSAEDRVANQASPDAGQGNVRFQIETGRSFDEVESALRKHFIDKHPAFAALSADPGDVRQLNSPEYRRKIAELATASPVTSVINSFPGKPSRTIVERTELSDKEMSVVEIGLYHNKDGTCRVDVQVEQRQKRDGVSYAKTKSISETEIRKVVTDSAAPADDDKKAGLQPGKYNLRLLVPKMAKDKQDVTFPADVIIDRDSLSIKSKGMAGNPITLTGTQKQGDIKFGLAADEKGKKLTFEYAGKIASPTSAEGKLRVSVDGKELFDGTWSLASADEVAEESVTLKVVDADRAISRTVSNQTQIGFSNTKIFYSLEKQHAVVVVYLGDKDKKFAASGKVHVFAKGVTADDLGKWVTNQHSDGLFANIPEPVTSHTLPADAIKMVSTKLLKNLTGPDGETYEEHSVDFAAEEIAITKTLRLAAFKDSATAYTKAAAEKKTGALKTLKGKRLLVGYPSSVRGQERADNDEVAFKKGATQVKLHSPMANFDKGVGDFLAVIDLETPVTQEQVDAYTAFAKLHAATTAPVLIIEFPEKKRADEEGVKGRLIGAGNYPTARVQDFTDEDLKDQPFMPFDNERQ